jgi:hypothetical protein
MNKIIVTLMFVLCCGSAFAWNCSNPLAERVLVPSNTSGTYGDGDGQLALFNGQVYECEVVKPAKPSGPVASPVTNTNTNTNSNSNTNNNTLNQTQNQGQTQGQKQGQSQSSSNNNQSSATSNGDNSNDSITNIAAPKIPVSSAYAPTTIPSAPCVKGFGAGFQTMPVGGSFGGNKIDEGCDARETARSYALLGSRIAACKVMIHTKQSRKAGVTLEDCMHTIVPPVQVAALPVVQPQPIIVNPVAPVVNIVLPQPPEYKTEMTVVGPKPVVKKRVVHHLAPNCQNVVQRVCKP